MRNLFSAGPFAPASASLGDYAFRSEHTRLEPPPMLWCNPAWDPGCPRALPTRTLVPYLPSSREMGVSYSALWRRAKPKDRSGLGY